MRSKCLLVAIAVATAACSRGGGDDATTSTTRPTGGCPVAAATVAEVLERPVDVERLPRSGGCRYVGEDAGARVEVVARADGGDAYARLLGDVEREVGPTEPLPAGAVDGAERGWVVRVGRAVQLGAARGRTLVVVAVTDPLLDADGAQRVAAALAGEALSG